MKNKVKKTNLFQEKVNQTLENKTKNYQKTIKNGLLVDLVYLQNSIYTIIKIKKTYSYKYNNKYINIHILI